MKSLFKEKKKKKIRLVGMGRETGPGQSLGARKDVQGAGRSGKSLGCSALGGGRVTEGGEGEGARPCPPALESLHLDSHGGQGGAG